MVFKYMTKVYKQHTTMVTSLPIAVRDRLRLTKGDYLFWQVDRNSDFVQISKVEPRGIVNGKTKGNSDRED